MKNLPIVLGVLAAATALPAWMPDRAKPAAAQAEAAQVFGKPAQPEKE